MTEAAVVGVACRLPGAPSIASFWSLLRNGQNSVQERPAGRWSIERFLRPGLPEPGFAYTFAGGYLDNPFSFDPAPFGISPREAQQIDPQQRLLLEVAWNAFEDAGIAPGSLAGQNVGVYIGASTVDYQSGASHDPAVMESHFMTGNSLSILSNRISYAFDLRGPSFTIDSACSSSFVALCQALVALRDGQIDMALVGGVNLLLSPAPFIGFSQARMLSPTGQSRPFSQDADGYVRSEGAVVFLLRRLKDATARGDRIRSVIMGAAANSDGRTSGISLPSFDGQRRLIENVYSEMGLSPERLAFVEAHGTGTKVGDPIEAAAIGNALGRRRTAPLPIGSVKSNIGHLEATSGLAGLLKATLALENRILPRSLFLDVANESIDFADLNLAPNATERSLSTDSASPLIAGVCNYGFGGTNAHVVLRAAALDENVSAARTVSKRGKRPQLLLVSAASQAALADRATQLADAIGSGVSCETLATALGHQNSLMKFRLAAPVGDDTRTAVTLRRYSQNENVDADFTSGQAVADGAGLAFVFSGNGSQFGEMGKIAYAENAKFRAEIADIDRFFQPLAGWSIKTALEEGIEDGRLEQTSISQPLIYAIQSALVAILKQAGIRANAVLGHSVGEVAAAEACGALSRAEAVRLILLRSKHQELARGQGRMLVIAADLTAVERELAAFGPDGIEIAAINSPTSTTLSGMADRLAGFARHCRKARLASIPLDIDYPFHSSILDPLRQVMVADLGQMSPQAGDITFLSAVSGGALSGTALDAEYWWRNVRQTVRFSDAVIAAIERGIELFLEIGPRAILTGPIGEILRDRSSPGQILTSLSNKDTAGLDPVRLTLARLVVAGANFDADALFGPKQVGVVNLPGYPFQRQPYNLPGTSEALHAYGRMSQAEARHPLLGARMADDSPEWRNLIDPVLVPYLNDHRVDGGVIVPAAGLIEMALAVGRDLFGDKPLELDEFDVFKALAIGADEMREVSTRYTENTQTVEIWSRRRFLAQEWTLHARGVISVLTRPRTAPLSPPIEAEKISDTAAEVYAEATRAGLEYGKRFQLVTASERDAVTTDALLAAPSGGLGAFGELHVLHPASLDAAFHGLFISRPQIDGEMKAHLPVRFRKICVWQQGATIRRAITLLTHETNRFKTVAITLLDEAGSVVASIEAAVLRALYLSKASIDDRTFRQQPLPLFASFTAETFEKLRRNGPIAQPEPPAPWLLTRAFCVSLAHRTLAAMITEAGVTTLEALAGTGAVARAALPYFRTVLDVLAEFGAIETSADGSRLSASSRLPDPEALLSTLLSTFPHANLEVRLAAQSLTQMASTLRTGEFVAAPAAMIRRLEIDSILSQPAIAGLAAALESLAASATPPRKLRVLAFEPWGYGLDRVLMPLFEAGKLEITLAAASPDAIESYRIQHGGDVPFEFADLSVAAEPEAAAFHDVAVAVVSRPFADGDHDALRKAARLLAEGAPILIAQPGTDCHLDMLCGIWSGWLTATGRQASRIPAPDATLATLEAAGAKDVRSSTSSDGLGQVITARMPDDLVAPEAAASAIAMAAAPEPSAILDLACRAFPNVLALPDARDETLVDWVASIPAESIPTLFVQPHALKANPAEQLALRVERIKSILEALERIGRPARVWVLTHGAHELTHGTHDEATDKGAVSAGIWGFVRVAINEFPAIDLRLVDFETSLPAEPCTVAMEQILAKPGTEREWFVTTGGIAVNRVRRGLFDGEALGPNERSVLNFDQTGRLDNFEWLRTARPAPNAGEIAIDVAAVGLNFRDVLVGLGILDDDLLGAGLTAAALGFECSGIVRSVGAGVVDFKPGDPVMGFASDAFASHLVAPSWHFFAAPSGVAIEAAATIPVAFATAWFALMHRARIAKGEDVLIHGAAGGVGLAAIQIAKHVGARVLATASNAERRAIARAAGADLVFESRQERFAEAIQRDMGGVDVVLNSLAGSAMAASFKLVKPFGRFVELGKRDYLDNTKLGLRPFVRNIAYFGVDLDELLAHDRGFVQAMMAELSALFASEEFRPLPHQIYEAHEIGAAFRSMQASEHVGKIVIRPAHIAKRSVSNIRFRAKAGTYLVVGGTSGLGFATAQWLSGKGASTLVLASRRGKVEEELLPEIAAMEARGVKVIVATLDVTDAAAVKKLVKTISSTHEPVRGVIHAAVQLDDGMISGLTPERLRAVLAPKVAGALNLEAATAEEPLDFFVVYSSATTVIGSPGQGAYVAANAFLEGFARRRRAQGKSALAIGWGAISDVGIIARDKQLGRRLRRTTGVVGIRSAEALAHLGRLLALGDAVGPMQFYTNIAPGAAAEKLALLKSPTFHGLALARREEGIEEGGDLISTITGKSTPEAQALITQALRHEVSHILRMPADQVDVDRPLAELGLDSLMALELHLSIERLSGTEMPMVGAGDRRLIDIAASILAQVLPHEQDDGIEPRLDEDKAQLLSLAQKHSTQGMSIEDVSELQAKLRVGGRRG